MPKALTVSNPIFVAVETIKCVVKKARNAAISLLSEAIAFQLTNMSPQNVVLLSTWIILIWACDCEFLKKIY